MARSNTTRTLIVFALFFVVGYALVTVLRKEHLTAGCSTPAPQKGFDRPGNDITMIDNIPTSQECANRCCATAGCDSYTHYNGRQCFLKRGQAAPVATNNPDMGTGVVNRSATLAAPPLANGKIYKCSTGTEFGVVLDNKLTGFPDPSVAASYSPTWSADATALDCNLYNRATGPAPLKAAAAPAAAAPAAAAPAAAATAAAVDTPVATPAATPAAESDSSGGMDTSTIVLTVLAVLTVVGAGIYAYTKMKRPSYPTYGNRWR